MSRSNKRIEHIRLERYLSGHFHFQLNEIAGAIEFKRKGDPEWEELNEFNIYRQLKLRNSERFETHFKKWLVRTIKCALDDQ